MVETIRRRRYTGEAGENIPLSLRLNKGLLDRIDAICKEDSSFAGRAHFIDSAVRAYVNTVKCPNCSARVDKNSRVCPFCETKLDNYTACVDQLKQHLTICIDCIKEVRNYFEKTNPLESDIAAHTIDRHPEIQEQLNASTEMNGMKMMLKKVRESTAYFLETIDTYSSLSNDELHLVDFERNLSNSINGTKDIGGGAFDFSQDAIEKQVHKYILTKRKYDNNKEFDNINIRELEEDIHTLNEFSLFAKWIELNIKSSYLSFKIVDSYLVHTK